MYIEKLAKSHPVRAFDCGVPALNTFLHRYALQNQKKDGVQTWVALWDQQEVVGYYSLVVGEVGYEGSPEHLRKGLARHPVPVMILARLAVDRNFQGKRIGQGLLLDALRRTVQAADLAGIRALLVHAKDETAARFYAHFGFQPFPEEHLTLYWLLKDIRAMMPKQ
jgi:GNAT superfamily N-acetyltransferase